MTPLPITGVGLVTPLGRSAADTWRSLMAGRRIADHTRVEHDPALSTTRVTSLAIKAAAEAVRHADLYAAQPVAVVACTSKGPVEEWLRPTAGPTSDNGPVGGGATSDDDYGMASVANGVARHLRLGHGPRLTVCSACSGGLQALGRAALLIQSGEADRVLVVASEASVHPLFLASFRRLGVLPPPGELCRPFDRRRQGFLMSESAAAICLESPAIARRPLAYLTRWATGGDATSLTGGDGRTLRRLLADVLTGPVDLVHAHGTGTPLNDAAELAAFAHALPDGGAGTALYSHKAALGHTLGAAGLVAAVLSTLAHVEQTIPGNVNTTDAEPTRLRLARGPLSLPVRTSLAVAAGFGGGVTVATLRSA